jgi:hypothetical protein
MSTTNEPTVKLNVGMQVGYIANSTREYVVDTGITRSEWDAMPEDERNQIRDDYAQGAIDETVSAWAELVED